MERVLDERENTEKEVNQIVIKKWQEEQTDSPKQQRLYRLLPDDERQHPGSMYQPSQR